MIKYSWHNESVPDDLRVSQVYGVLFNEFGQVLLMARERDGELIYSLSGGTPENYETSIEQTLRRELIEEVNTTIKEPIYLGYQKVEGDGGKPAYAQVRMVAVIDEIGERKPDPDNGETYQRLLTNCDNAIGLLHWGAVGESIIKKAAEKAQSSLNIKMTDAEDKWI